MIKLIASDMDGTLLDQNMTITDENVAAIKEAQAAGIEFMIATGRQLDEAKPLVTKHDLDTAYITLNGAQVFSQEGKLEVEAPISYDWGVKIMKILYQEDLYFELLTSNGVYSENKVRRLDNIAHLLASLNPETPFKLAIALSSARVELMNIKYVENYMTVLDDPKIDLLKIVAYDSEANSAEKFKRATKKLLADPGLVITSSSIFNIEINDIKAQKGIALKAYAEKKGLSAENVMSLGDNLNDTSMIEYAKYSVAMENAVESIKEKAHWHTDTNNNSGVAKAIRRAIELNKKEEAENSK